MTTAALGVVLAVAACMATGARRGTVAVLHRTWPRWPAALGACLVLVSLVGLRASQDLEGLAAPLPGHVDGVAELGSDPEASRFGSQAELVVEGRRWLASFDRSLEFALEGLRAGDRIAVEARARAFSDAPIGWVRSRHLAGRLDVRSATAVGGTPVWFRAANQVHELLERGAASMGADHRALYLGLVVGDDRGQSELTRFRFRASGLTHLLAVSGQNLVFVLAVLAPVLGRVSLRWRWILGVAAVVGFVVVTRAEPSVLRAATMTALALSANLSGRRVSGPRTVALAVVVLLLCDPMLVHSVGFRLSVAATSGIVLLTGWLRERMPGPPWLRLPVAVTLGAQAGAVPVMTATFGPASVVSVPANLLAEPAAGAVMTLGMSSGLLCGVLREELAWVLQMPVRACVWWVDTVARIASQVAVPPAGLAGWAAIAGGVAAGVRLHRSRPRNPGTALCVALVPLLVLARPSSPMGVAPAEPLPSPVHPWSSRPGAGRGCSSCSRTRRRLPARAPGARGTSTSRLPYPRWRNSGPGGSRGWRPSPPVGTWRERPVRAAGSGRWQYSSGRGRSLLRGAVDRVLRRAI
ncbi:MAG: ComEC/Rec2 family competence protein [Microthrixaceae bacterium]